MKLLIALICLIYCSSFALGQGAYNAWKYRSSGLSMDKTAGTTAKKDVAVIALAGIPQDSPKFKEAFDLVHARYSSMTFDQFVQTLQEGKFFDVYKNEDPVTCKECSGAGKISDAKAKTPDRKSPCKPCNGTGKISPRSYFRICLNP